MKLVQAGILKTTHQAIVLSDVGVFTFFFANAGGLLLNLGAARLEANYCVPLMRTSADLARPGLQVGIGISFL